MHTSLSFVLSVILSGSETWKKECNDAKTMSFHMDEQRHTDCEVVQRGFHTSLGQVKWAKTAIKVSAVTTLGVGVEGRTWHAAATGKARSATVKRWVFTAHIVYIHKTLFKWWQTASQLQYKLCAWRHNMPRPFPPPWVPKRLTRRRADAM